MVACWETRAFFRVQRTLQAILVMACYIPGADVTQLLPVCTDQVKDYKQQNSHKTIGECRSGWNPRTHDECDLMPGEIQAAAVRCAAREDSLQKTIGIKPTSEVRKVTRARKTRKDSGKAQEPRTLTTRRKELATIAKVVGHFALNFARRKREPHNVSYSGGLEKVGPVMEHSNITELLMDSGAASRAG